MASSSLVGSILKRSRPCCDHYVKAIWSSRRASTTPPAPTPAPELMRNVGIIAHINAGKTTTTERILYHSGTTKTVGDVDLGNTVTDYLVQERERGITISSAAVTYNWRKHQVNLIDTPGHVDFTVEVERSLAVLDGAVIVLDASAGVEAQTVTVWRQAARYKLANVIFLNKCDKPQADHRMCLEELKAALDIDAYLVQLPLKDKGGKLGALLDVIGRRQLSWPRASETLGAQFEWSPLAEVKLEASLLDELEAARELLVERLADLDDHFAAHVLDCERLSQVEAAPLASALRRATLGRQLSPVLVGSSFRHVGVQPLMDAMLDYLPGPGEREAQLRAELGPSGEAGEAGAEASGPAGCAFIFKTLLDKRLGPLSYVRICGGRLRRADRWRNLATGQTEQVRRVYRLQADELTELEAGAGRHDIVALSGLVGAKTGDILVEPAWWSARAHELAKLQEELQECWQGRKELLDDERDEAGSLAEVEPPFRWLAGGRALVPLMSRPQPVYHCSLEARDGAHQVRMEAALEWMAREDPSFEFHLDELGLTSARGMGRLHLEVVRDRLRSEHQVDCLLGPLQVSYRETITCEAEQRLSVNKLINGHRSSLQLCLRVRPKPGAGLWRPSALRLERAAGAERPPEPRHDQRRALEAGLASCLAAGPELGVAVVDVELALVELEASARCSAALLSSSASQALASALSSAQPRLLEPVMRLELLLPQPLLGQALADLATRRARVLRTRGGAGSGAGELARSASISCLAPLSALADYSDHVRRLSSGRASLAMRLHGYRALSAAERAQVGRL